MSEVAFQAKLVEAGWGALARQAWDLGPAEVAALRQMMRAPGVTITLWDIVGRHDSHPLCARTASAARTRVQRLRRKIEDVGLGGHVETVLGEGYRISLVGVAAIERALAYACGVAP